MQTVVRKIDRRTRRQLVEELESRRLMDVGRAMTSRSSTRRCRLQHLAAAVANQENVILYDGRRDSAAKVLDKLVAGRRDQNSRSTPSRSSRTAPPAGFSSARIGSLRAVQKRAWQKLGKVLADDASIYLFGCNIAADAKGELLLDHLAALSGADVYRSSDLTG
jgi:hypothetical protein